MKITVFTTRLVMMHMMRMRFSFLCSAISIYDFKIRHHPRFMVFQDMTMVHPATNAVVRHPGDFDLASWR